MSGKVDLEKVYRAAPIWAQNMFVNLEGWRVNRLRYGRAYDEVAAEVEQRKSLQGVELRTFQGRRLESHLSRAATTTFWRTRFGQYGVRPQGSDPFAELAKLPVLSKKEVQAHASELQASLEIGPLRNVHTSGTTGAGLVFSETAAAEMERWAVWWRFRRGLGITPNTRCGYFGGRSVVPVRQVKPPFWRFNYTAKQLLLSAYHLSPATSPLYWEALRKWGTVWLHGYPSFISLLAQGWSEAGSPALDDVRWITTGAENLLARQRACIESVFKVPVRQHYGQAESVANFSEDATGMMSVDEDFALVEFDPIPGTSDCFRIVGTNWSNPAFPLFRYDTGDTAQIESTASDLGGWRRVLSVDGRKEDYILLPNNVRVGRLDHIFKDLTHIREAQIWQPSRERVVLRIVKGVNYDVSGEEARLLLEMRLRLGMDIGVDIQYCLELPRTATGKLRFVVSDLKEGEIDELHPGTSSGTGR